MQDRKAARSTKPLATHGRTIQRVMSAVFAMSAMVRCMSDAGKIAAAPRTDVEGHLQSSAEVQRQISWRLA